MEARVCSACGVEELSYKREGFKVTDHIGSGTTTIWCVPCFDQTHNPQPSKEPKETKKRGRPKKEPEKDELPMTEEQAANSELPVE